MTDSFPTEADLAVTDDHGEGAVVIAYDIQDDERRNEVRSICSGYGQWVQRSVFRCAVTEAQYQELREKLLKVINEEKDHICAYLLAQPTEETAAEWGTSEAIRELMSKLKALSEEERRKVLQSID